MRLRKKQLESSRLYVLIDKSALKGPVLRLARSLAKSGAGIIQLRDKDSFKEKVLKEAIKLKQALKGTPALVIVNDYLDIAIASKSDGLHIGQLDIPIKEARRKLGSDKLIGVSCSNLKEALIAQAAGADYVAIGPVFKTETKPGCRPVGLKAIKALKGKIRIPVFAIGNINSGNLGKVISSGIDRVALCRAVLNAKDPVKATKYFLARLGKIK